MQLREETEGSQPYIRKATKDSVKGFKVGEMKKKCLLRQQWDNKN